MLRKYENRPFRAKKQIFGNSVFSKSTIRPIPRYVPTRTLPGPSGAQSSRYNRHHNAPPPPRSPSPLRYEDRQSFNRPGRQVSQSSIWTIYDVYKLLYLFTNPLCAVFICMPKIRKIGIFF